MKIEKSISCQLLQLAAVSWLCPLAFLVNAQQLPIATAAPMAAGVATGGGAGALVAPSIRAAEATEAAKLTSRALALDPLKPNDFQQFVLQTTGQRLPLFGYQFFENINASHSA